MTEYHKLASDPIVNKYLPDGDCVNSETDAKRHIDFMIKETECNISLFLAIADSLTGNLIGTIGLNYWDKEKNQAFIVYELMKCYWNQGIITMVVNYITDFAFTYLGIKVMKAHIMLENKASQKVLKKNGFSCEGIVPFHKPIRQRLVKVYLYSKSLIGIEAGVIGVNYLKSLEF